MADRLRVVRCGMDYPIGESLQRVYAAGGLRRMSLADRAALTMKRVEVGDWCDDVPVESVARLLAAGIIEIVPGESVIPRSALAADNAESEV